MLIKKKMARIEKYVTPDPRFIFFVPRNNIYLAKLANPPNGTLNEPVTKNKNRDLISLSYSSKISHNHYIYSSSAVNPEY